ncbi:hypothetical protein [Pseudaminobacter sp. NGMCC 1.201702]|uniref:hypothetical protein n=1 Tax=Pseudaminobacter sp. NGMCC 1.201702 TaxID=3391825 RepID=UPI0039F05B21
MAISIRVDGEYPDDDDAHDIVLTAQRLFASADVNMVKVVPPGESRAASPMLGTADGGGEEKRHGRKVPLTLLPDPQNL